MSRKGRSFADFFKESKFLGQSVGKTISFLADTACMHKDDRVNIAYCEIFGMLLDFSEKYEDDEFNIVDFLNEFAIPAFCLLGYADWDRDVLTDLSLALSKVKTKRIDLGEKNA